MLDDIKERTKKTAALYFDGFEGERPYNLWKHFDKDLAKDLSLFITGAMYSRERIPHPHPPVGDGRRPYGPGTHRRAQDAHPRGPERRVQAAGGR